MSELLSPEAALTPEGQWLLVQLRITEAWAARSKPGDVPDDENDAGTADTVAPPTWRLTEGLKLWNWQEDCARTWLEHDRRGIAKVVTGAGKTVFAQHLIERLQSEIEPGLCVAVVVPTIVLMRQWVHSLTTNSNLPPGTIGRLGGGSHDRFGDRTRILVCVINTAAARLAEVVQSAGVGERLLLIVDECHRAGGAVMSRVFKTPRRYSLGLSATPERDESPEMEGTQSAAERTAVVDAVTRVALGPIIYELGVREAVAAGILSTFEIRHYGLPLEAGERMTYDKLSRDIRTLEKTLKARAASRPAAGASLFRYAQRLAAGDGPLAREARQYVQNIRRRKMLLYRARGRTDGVLALVTETFRQSPDAKILIFHEKISEVMRLYLALLRAGHRVTVDHSKLPESMRADSIELFRSDAANVLISARALIEGFDVPSADVGIIAASSASPRQRIQTIGRILRRPKDGRSKCAVIHTLYMSRTVDERIYDRVDWDQVTGAERNAYFLWAPPEAGAIAGEETSEPVAPIPQDAPPRRPRPREAEIDWGSLQEGGAYPGRFEGLEYRVDQQGNVFDASNQPIANPQGVPERLSAVSADGVRFKITVTRRAILYWDRTAKTVRFAGFLAEPFKPLAPAAAKAGKAKKATPSADAALEYKVVQFRGARRIKNYAGRLALEPDLATDRESGEDAKRILASIHESEARLGKSIQKFYIENNEAYCIVDGRREVLFQLKKGLEFK